MGVTGFQIRPARPEDSVAIARLIDELGYQVTADDVVARLPELALTGGSALVGEWEGRVVACLTLSMMRVLHRPAPVGRVSMFVVGAEMRGHGFGKLMLDEAKRRLAASGCELAEVTSQLRRTQAHAFYGHLGWERTNIGFVTRADDTVQGKQ